MTVHLLVRPRCPDTHPKSEKINIAISCLYICWISVPKEILEYCPKKAKVVNSANLSLDQIMHEIVIEHRKKDISDYILVINCLVCDGANSKIKN